MTLAQLKRSLFAGKTLKLVYRFGKQVDKIRTVDSLKTTRLYFQTEEGKKSWLGFPPASLIEITEDGFSIFNPGYRPLTENEKSIRDGYETIRYHRQEEIDALSDGNVSYWRMIAYFKKHDALYLIDHEEKRGMRYRYDKEMVRDNRIKGDKVLEYRFIPKMELAA